MNNIQNCYSYINIPSPQTYILFTSVRTAESVTPVVRISKSHESDNNAYRVRIVKGHNISYTETIYDIRLVLRTIRIFFCGCRGPIDISDGGVTCPMGGKEPVL
jgi:hypothetical protein